MVLLRGSILRGSRALVKGRDWRGSRDLRQGRNVMVVVVENLEVGDRTGPP
jgi:hypothetical protein